MSLSSIKSGVYWPKRALPATDSAARRGWATARGQFQFTAAKVTSRASPRGSEQLQLQGLSAAARRKSALVGLSGWPAVVLRRHLQQLSGLCRFPRPITAISLSRRFFSGGYLSVTPCTARRCAKSLPVAATVPAWLPAHRAGRVLDSRSSGCTAHNRSAVYGFRFSSPQEGSG